MGLILLALFVAVPLVEIAVFIKVGGIIGLGWTLACVVLTAVIGTALLRQQGLATLQRAQDSMARNEMPLRELFDGACLLVAGVLLLTPGFVTDAAGALLLLPPIREVLRQFLARRLVAGNVHVHGFPGNGPFDDEPFGNGSRARPTHDVIDGEY